MSQPERHICLARLRLRNFKGIKDYTLTPAGESISIYGDNATGKTTLADGFHWCLFGKDSLGTAVFEIKTLDASGNVAEHGIEHEVELELLDSAAEHPLIFRKVLTEKWTKKRGSATREFTGHEVNHFVDGVPVSKRQYDEAVARLAEERLFRLITNPRHFNEGLHWQQRRELLLDVCGDVSDAQVIEQAEELRELPGILGSHKLDDYRKILVSRRNEINKELSSLPIRIDEASRSIVQVEKNDPKSIQATLVHLVAERANLESQIVFIQSGGEVADKTKRLRELEAALQKHDNDAFASLELSRKVKREELNALRNKLSDTGREIVQRKTDLNILRAQIEVWSSERESLRQKWIDRNEQNWVATVRCPTCDQPLPDDQIQSARERFNVLKAEALSEISRAGKKLAVQIEQATGSVAQLFETIATLEFSSRQTEVLIPPIEQDLAEIAPSNEDPKRSEMVAGIEILKSNLSELAIGSRDEVMELRDKVAGVNTDIQAHEKMLAQLDINKASEKRIEEYKASERKLAREYEEVERKLSLCERFVVSKVAMLEDRINSQFQLAQFKLFSKNINGGIEDCCETMVNGVPYSSLNNAARINVGIDISNALSLHYGVRIVQWIDNSEAVSEILPSQSQQIKLYVSAAHPQLAIGG